MKESGKLLYSLSKAECKQFTDLQGFGKDKRTEREDRKSLEEVDQRLIVRGRKVKIS